MTKIICTLSAYSAEIFSSLSTLFAAFLGAWFAFKLQNNHEKNVISEENRTALNMIQVELMRKYNELLVIKKNFVSPIIDDPLYWMNIPSLSPRERTDDINVSSLSFLVDSGEISVISEILIAMEMYNEIVKSVNIRSIVHKDELQPKYENIIRKYNGNLSLEILVKELSERTVGTLINATNGINELLPDAIAQFEKVVDLLYKAGKKKYPKRKIVIVAKKEEKDA
ncbi:MAG: hypothetical protein KA785_10185 [Spirochaetaceae bacterium]|nr:hypothetical protein [Spirochaetaceae bacterium]